MSIIIAVNKVKCFRSMFFLFRKKIFRFLRKHNFLPKLNVVLNQQVRNLSQKYVSVDLKIPRKHKSILIHFSLKQKDFAYKNAVLVANFYDGRSQRISTDSFSESKEIGSYLYIEDLVNHISIHIPEKATNVRIKIMEWNKSENNLFLLSGSKLEFLKYDIKSIVIEKGNQLIKNIDSINIQDIIKDLQYKELYVLFKYVTDKIPLEYVIQIGKIAMEQKPSLILMKMIKNLYNKNGDLLKLYEFYKHWEEFGISIGDLYKNKLENQIDLLQNGFKFSEATNICPYEKKKRVLYLLHNSLPYNSGGYATRSHGILTNINKHTDWEAIAVTRPGYPSDMQKSINQKLDKIPDFEKVDDVKYIRCSQQSKASYSINDYINQYADELCMYAEKYNVSLIHAVSNYPNAMAAIEASRRLGIKCCYEIRGLWEITKASREEKHRNSDIFKLQEKLETQGLQNADKKFTITTALANLMKDRGVDDHINVIHNAVDIEKFIPIEEKDEGLIEKYDLEDKIVIGYIGSIVEYEGLNFLIDATKNLVDSGIKNIKVIIVGDGAVLNDLKATIEMNELSEFVVTVGHVSYEEVNRYYSIMDIMTIPRRKAWVTDLVSPLKPFEIMAMKKVLITSDCDALQEIVQNGKTGLLFKADDVNDYTEKLKLLIEDEKMRNELAQNGLEWVKENRTWDKIAKKIVEVYEEC